MPVRMIKISKSGSIARLINVGWIQKYAARGKQRPALAMKLLGGKVLQRMSSSCSNERNRKNERRGQYLQRLTTPFMAAA